MVDLTNAPEGSLWLNRRGDVLRVGYGDVQQAVKMHFVSSEHNPEYARGDHFTRVYIKTGHSYYSTEKFDIVAPAYTECPY
jgi:hypothetical protein